VALQQPDFADIWDTFGHVRNGTENSFTTRIEYKHKNGVRASQPFF